MNVTTLNLSASSQKLKETNATVIAKDISTEVLQTKVVSIRSARKAQEAAKQELLDYLLWTMKHDMDPHRLYDDPIEVYRSELKNVVGIA